MSASETKAGPVRFQPELLLKLEEHIPLQAKYPVIDAHNHLFGDLPVDRLLPIMDEVNVRVFNNVSGNARLPLAPGGYSIESCPFDDFKQSHLAKHPERFCAFTMAGFARWDDFALFRHKDFVDRCIQQLEADRENGAMGLKVTKELGLRFQDLDDRMIPVDDGRLDPVWKRAGELGIPVLIHTSDPVGFFLPINEKNEHYHTLQEYTSWSFHGSHFSKDELLAQRNRIIAKHPGTTFICPHMANHAENLGSVGDLMRRHDNMWIDFSARIDELGRQPNASRDFFLEFQDRILFGTDMPLSPDIYRCYFRFLETRDDCFEYPDYFGRWGYSRWKICGLGLADEVLRKVYYENALRLLPGLDTAGWH